MAFENVSVLDTMNGASGDVAGIFELDPMCMQTTVPVSSHARNSGSQKRPLSWTDGRPSGWGFSLKAMPRLPLSAHAAHLGGGQLGVPQRHDREREQPALALARRPLVEHPVVVGLHAEQGELLVGPLVERLAGEAGERVREADRRLDVVGVHVGEPLGLDPAAGPDLVEGGRGDVEVVEADGRRQLGERVDEVVVEPPVAPLAVLDAPLVGEDAALEVELRPVALDPRGRGRGTSPGSRSVHRVGGSTTWSSTEMMRGISTSVMGPILERVLVLRIPGQALGQRVTAA